MNRPRHSLQTIRSSHSLVSLRKYRSEIVSHVDSSIRKVKGSDVRGGRVGHQSREGSQRTTAK